MADTAKLDTTAIDRLLQADPSEVAATGIAADIRKGIADGFAGLQALLKGKMAEKPAEPSDEDDDGDEPADEPPADGAAAGGDEEPEDKKADAADPEDKKGPGYDDMRLGKDGQLEIDATEYLLGLEAKVDSQARELRSLRKAVRDGRSENIATRQELREAIAALGGVLAPMAKAIQNTHQSMLDIPAAVHDPGRSGRTAAAKVALERAREATPGIDNVVLSKGLRSEIITDAQLQRYRTTGLFTVDETENAAIVTRLLK